MTDEEIKQILAKAERHEPYLRFDIPLPVWGMSVAIAAVAFLILFFVPGLLLSRDASATEIAQAWWPVLAVFYVLLYVAHELPRWRCLPRPKEYETTGNALAHHYYTSRVSFSATLSYSRWRLSLLSRFICFLVCSIWTLPFLYYAYASALDEVEPTGIRSPRMEAAAYDTLQARQFDVNGAKFTMIYVKGGRFTMGATNNQGFTWKKGEPDELRRANLARVRLDDYYIGRTEVTNELWDAVMGTKSKGRFLPKIRVTWVEWQEFIRRLSAMTGEPFRMPTRAEWEFAARGGLKSHGYRYAGSNDHDSVAWSTSFTVGKMCIRVASRKWANELGIFDMSGNLAEWLYDNGADNRCRDGLTNPAYEFKRDTLAAAAGGWYGDTEVTRRVSVIGRFPRHASRANNLGLRLVLNSHPLTHVTPENVDSLREVYHVEPMRQPTDNRNDWWKK